MKCIVDWDAWFWVALFSSLVVLALYGYSIFFSKGV
jgi:hypothetical protein